MNQQQYEYEVMREMELRDYFAAKAMQGFCANHAPDITPNTVNIEAKIAYQIADAMMEVRKNG